MFWRTPAELEEETIYLGVLTARRVKPLSRIEYPVEPDMLDLFQDWGLAVGQVVRIAQDGTPYQHLVLSYDPVFIEAYCGEFDNTIIQGEMPEGIRAEARHFGYPACCAESFAVRRHAPNGLTPEQQGLLFHHACPGCRETPLLIPRYREALAAARAYYLGFATASSACSRWGASRFDISEGTMKLNVTRVSLDSERFQMTLEKHRAFWTRGENGFLRSTGLFAPSVPSRLPQPDGSFITQADPLTPDMVHPDLLIAEVDSLNLAQLDADAIGRRQALLHFGLGDVMPLSGPFFKIPWLEAILGCPIAMTEGQIWVKPYPGDLERIIQQGAHFAHNPWFQLYLEFLRLLQERVADRYPVSANTLFRGTCDLAAQILGVKEAALGWIEDPSLMARLLRVGTDANLAIIEAGNAALRPFLGGYMSAFGIWSPDPVVRTQADHSLLLSPRMYEQQILPYDLEVIRSCPKAIMHLHNNGLHIAPILAEIPELDAIEVVVDPYPTEARKPYEMEMYQCIQQSKPLILDVNLPNYEEGERVLACLGHRGLSFHAQFVPELFATLPDGLPGSEHWECSVH